MSYEICTSVSGCLRSESASAIQLAIPSWMGLAISSGSPVSGFILTLKLIFIFLHNIAISSAPVDIDGGLPVNLRKTGCASDWG